jgi:hypothetical protein
MTLQHFDENAVNGWIVLNFNYPVRARMVAAATALGDS